MNWIDAHAHLADSRIESQLSALLSECARAGIHRFVLGGVDPEDWLRQEELVEKFPGQFFMTFGLHPWWVANRAHDESELAAGLAKLETALESPTRSCVGVGELGLDFQSRFSKSTHAVQSSIFRKQLRLAFRHDLPLVLHCVSAHEPCLEILRSEMRTASKVQIAGIVHSFSGNPALARAYLDLGLTPSISAAVITRGSGSAFENLKQTMVTLSAKEFVLETDAPDQPPYPRAEGKERELNLPVNLIRVAEVVAKIRAETVSEILDESRETIQRIFRLVPL